MQILEEMVSKGLIQQIRQEESVGYLISDKGRDFLSIEER
jgi:predicted transcriptional regulator